MKQKLYFQLSAMNVGGVEKSFLGLLTTLSPEKYEIHLGLLDPTGGYMESIPNYVHIHKVDCYNALRREINDPPLQYIKDYIRHGHLKDAIMHLYFYIIYKLSQNRYPFYEYILRNEPLSEVTYDKAFAYSGPSQMVDYYICKKIRAKEKYGWIHFDVKEFGIDKGMTRILYKDYKKVYVVSEQAKLIFDDLFPEFKDKTEVRYNVVSKEQCRSLAETAPTFEDKYKGIRILTVGRLSKEKGQDVTIDSLKILLDRGYNVKWYYVGDGNLRSVCEEKAFILGILDKVVFLGTQTNPYGFMRDCDIYMQPSRHEGYCITLAEARCFSAPIVATCFTGAKEQLETFHKSKITGMSAEEIANGIESIIKE